MAITPYLKGLAFDPEIVKAMGVAFEKACATLKAGPDDMLRVPIAQTVIALAQRGVKDPATLAAETVKEIKPE